MKSFAPPSKSVANTTSQRVSQPTKTILNNRPSAVMQRKLQEMANAKGVLQVKQAKGGLPEDLKAGIESLSGYSLDDVKVHYNSSKPAEVGALAYAQGNDIYLAPGQEKHLAHEAWHVVQQKQGRVRPTMQLEGGVAINDNVFLEGEADRMGQRSSNSTQLINQHTMAVASNLSTAIVQRVAYNIAPSDVRLGQENLSYRTFSAETLLDENNCNTKQDVIKVLDKPEPPKTNLLKKLIFNPTQEEILSSDRQCNLFNINFKNVELTEPIIFAGHGVVQDGITVTQQGYTAKDFCSALTNANTGLPEGYRGVIYLQGCRTAASKKSDFSESLAYNLYKSLKDGYPAIIVKGNINDTESHPEGIEQRKPNRKEIKNYRNLFNIDEEIHATRAKIEFSEEKWLRELNEVTNNLRKKFDLDPASYEGLDHLTLWSLESQLMGEILDLPDNKDKETSEDYINTTKTNLRKAVNDINSDVKRILDEAKQSASYVRKRLIVLEKMQKSGNTGELYFCDIDAVVQQHLIGIADLNSRHISPSING